MSLIEILYRLKGPAIISFATMIVFLVGIEHHVVLGEPAVFNFDSVYQFVIDSVVVALDAYLLMVTSLFIIWAIFALDEVGILLQVIFGTIGGAVTLWLFARLSPQTMQFADFWATLPWSLGVAGLTMLFGVLFGAIGEGVPFLPTRRAARNSS